MIELCSLLTRLVAIGERENVDAPIQLRISVLKLTRIVLWFVRSRRSYVFYAVLNRTQPSILSKPA